MDPIGVPASEWSWRENVYRAKHVNGLPSREFASGITITHRALARVGYLYLREGEWNGRQILSRDLHSMRRREPIGPSQLCTLLRVFLGKQRPGNISPNAGRQLSGHLAWATVSSGLPES